jgi:hypothetical protein
MSAPSETPLSIIARVLNSGRQADSVLAALRDAGWICVPKTPTASMLEAGWADAHAENAAGVWEEMIATVEVECYATSKGNSTTGNG